MVSKTVAALHWDVFRPRYWGKSRRIFELPKPWFGLDTERDADSGEFVCGWIVGETTARFSGFSDLDKGVYWVWNLAYDIEGMLRDLGIEEAWAAKVDATPFEIDGEFVRYFHGKRFDFGDKVFLEASSFFGRAPLKDFGAKEGIDASRMSLARYRRDFEYRKKVDSYCRQDARIVYDRIVELDAGTRNMGIGLGSTPGATARKFLHTLPDYPRVIWKTHKAFLRSYCGGRFELVKRGVVRDVNQYDLVSAYPWALGKCPWLTGSAESRYTRRVHDDALYGTYKVDFETDDYLGLAPTWRNGVRVYSAAENGVWLTKPEMDWLQRRGYEYKVLGGVEIFDENASWLWRDIIGGLFDLKKKTKKGVDKGWGAKIVLNSMYGILIMLVRKAGKWVPMAEAVNPVDFTGKLALEEPPKAFEGGKYYAPVYAGNLTALVRLRMMDAARISGYDGYVGGHTDSVLTKGKLPVGDRLGDWQLEDTAKVAHMCKTGMYALGSKVKMRGITREGTASLVWSNALRRNVRIGIKSAKDWGDVSLILPKVVAHNWRQENKRNWDGPVTRGLIAMEGHVDSEPYSFLSRP